MCVGLNLSDNAKLLQYFDLLVQILFYLNDFFFVATCANVDSEFVSPVIVIQIVLMLFNGNDDWPTFGVLRAMGRPTIGRARRQYIDRLDYFSALVRP